MQKHPKKLKRKEGMNWWEPTNLKKVTCKFDYTAKMIEPTNFRLSITHKKCLMLGWLYETRYYHDEIIIIIY